MRRISKTALAFAVISTFVSCRREAATPARKGPGPAIVPVLRFQPPADGLLTNAQIDHYLRVRRASRGRTDNEAASAVGVDPEEFAWARARIIEAMVYLETVQVRSAAEGTYSRTIASLKEAGRGAKDRETLRKIEEQIVALERERAGFKAPDPAPPAVVANARRIAPRKAELQAPPQ